MVALASNCVVHLGFRLTPRKGAGTRSETAEQAETTSGNGKTLFLKTGKQDRPKAANPGVHHFIGPILPPELSTN